MEGLEEEVDGDEDGGDEGEVADLVGEVGCERCGCFDGCLNTVWAY